ncbi:MAG TPA: hypothetical protein VKV15_16560 [Bryobacteraceae bacterium]|nr:hypothetical protein [Bryobacteraceae bacterium]
MQNLQGIFTFQRGTLEVNLGIHGDVLNHQNRSNPGLNVTSLASAGIITGVGFVEGRTAW